MRLDVYLTLNKICDSRNKATQLITDGLIRVNGTVICKPSFDVKDGYIVLADNCHQYVARSAVKLLTAIDKFGIDFKGLTVADLGASTGGFCEVMLEHGVKRIYAVDIGSNQLHQSIKSNSSVINIENTNARYIDTATFGETVDAVTCDLSFISLKLIIPSAYTVLKDGGQLICLIKPQFEAGRENLGKNGVVKDTHIHFSIIKSLSDFASDNGFDVKACCFSGLKGEGGNIEYLLYAVKDNVCHTLTDNEIKDSVFSAHNYN